MAITIVEFVERGQANGNSITHVWDASIAADDVAVVVCCTGWNLTSPGTDLGPVSGAGFTSLAAMVDTDARSVVTVSAKKMGSTPDVSTQTVDPGDNKIALATYWILFRGAADPSGWTVATDAALATAAPGFALSAGDAVVLVGGRGNNLNSPGVPSGWTGDTQIVTDTQRASLMVAYDLSAAAGTYGPVSYSANDAVGSASIVVPESGGGSPPAFAGSPWKDSVPARHPVKDDGGLNLAVKLSDGTRLE